MDRIINYTDLTKAIDKAYKEFKNNTAGSIPEKLGNRNAGKFGISMVLADGRRYNAGDTDTRFTLGSLADLPILTQLFSQKPVEEVMQKMGGGCKGNAQCKIEKETLKKQHAHLRGLRELSMIEPTGDIDAKMDIMSSTLYNLTGAAPVMDDDLYKARMDEIRTNDTVNELASAEYFLYDDAALTLDAYARLHSMQITTEQLANLGATIAADGVNPATRANVFDGKNSAALIASMAAKGPHKMRRQWLTITGVPAVSSFGGGFLAVVPGVGAFAAFSPELNEVFIPVKAALALKSIFTSLQINAFGSARIEIK